MGKEKEIVLVKRVKLTREFVGMHEIALK